MRGNLHKIVAHVATQDGIPLKSKEVTVKEAAYLVGVRFWKNYLEKRAMLDGIMNVAHIALDR